MNKLVYGYNNRIINTPNDISMCIIAFTQSQDALFLNEIKTNMITKINNSPTGGRPLWFQVCSIELYLDEFTAKLINFAHNIDKYRVEYKSKSLVDSVSTNEIGEQGLAFIIIETKQQGYFDEVDYSYRAQAVDDNNNCILQSQWITHKSFLVSPGWIQEEVVNKYFKENIDVNGKGYIGINEWIDSFTRTGGFDEFSVWEMKRIFYYIMHLQKNSHNTNEMKVLGQMDAKDFHLFLRNDPDKYNQIYKKFIDVLKDKVPNLFDDSFLGWIE